MTVQTAAEIPGWALAPVGLIAAMPADRCRVIEVGSLLEPSTPGSHELRAVNLALGAASVAQLSSVCLHEGVLLLAAVRVDYLVDVIDLDEIPLVDDCDNCAAKRAAFRANFAAAAPGSGAVLGHFVACDLTAAQQLGAVRSRPADPAPGSGGYL